MSVPALTPLRAMGFGRDYSCALTESATAVCWGYNVWGQLGDGTNTRRQTPTPVRTLTDAVALTVVSARAVRCTTTGASAAGGTTASVSWATARSARASRRAPSRICRAWSGSAQAVITTAAPGDDGRVFCWGHNGYGQLGDGTNSSRRRPVLVESVESATSIAVGEFNSCAVLEGGEVRCWGRNDLGNCGDGGANNRLSPVSVSALDEVVEVTVGATHSCARRSDGSVCAGAATSTTRWGGSAPRPSGRLARCRWIVLEAAIEGAHPDPEVFGGRLSVAVKALEGPVDDARFDRFECPVPGR